MDYLFHVIELLRLSELNLITFVCCTQRIFSGKFFMQALDEFATKLIENEHYAADDVAQRRDMVCIPVFIIICIIIRFILTACIVYHVQKSLLSLAC